MQFLTSAVLLCFGLTFSVASGQSHISKKDVCHHHIASFRAPSKLSLQNCSPGWTSFKTSCYLLLESPESWADALTSCQNLGATLVSVDSLEENTFLHKLGYQPMDTRSFWIGGYNNIGLPTWRWTDGTPFIFQKWAPGQPGGSGLDEHCMYISFKNQGFWYSYDCEKKIGFICEAVKH